MLFSPAVGPLFCHPSRCSGPQASSPARGQSSVLDRASGFLSPASSSLVHFTCCAPLHALRVWRALSSRDLATRHCFLEFFSLWHSMSRPPWHSMTLRRRFTRALVFDKLFACPRADPCVVLVGLLDQSHLRPPASVRGGHCFLATAITCHPAQEANLSTDAIVLPLSILST